MTTDLWVIHVDGIMMPLSVANLVQSPTPFGRLENVHVDSLPGFTTEQQNESAVVQEEGVMMSVHPCQTSTNISWTSALTNKHVFMTGLINFLACPKVEKKWANYDGLVQYHDGRACTKMLEPAPWWNSVHHNDGRACTMIIEPAPWW